MNYYCECCNYKTERYNNFQKHLSTKKHLAKNNVSKMYPNCYKCIQNVSKKSSSPENKIQIIPFECKYCGKKYKYSQGLSKHIKYNCKQSKDEDMKELVRLLNEIKEQNELKDKQINTLHKQIDKLTNKLQIQNINNTQNNTLNHIENNFNIKLLNHNDTDYSHLSDIDYINCIKQNNFCVKSLIETVHFNHEKPENKNIYISNIKTNYVMLYKNNKWQIVNRKEQIDNLYEYNEIVLEEWYENYKDKDNEMVKSFTRYLKSKEDNEVLNSIKNEILLLLYNNRLIENQI